MMDPDLGVPQILYGTSATSAGQDEDYIAITHTPHRQ